MYHTRSQSGIKTLTEEQLKFFPKVGDYVKVTDDITDTITIYKVLTRPNPMAYDIGPVQDCKIVYQENAKIKSKFPYIKRQEGEIAQETLILDENLPKRFKDSNYRIEKISKKELILYLL